MKRIFSILFALALVLTLSLVATTPVAAATTYYVATTGSNTNAGTSWGAAWRTIQHAVATAASGDTIMVAAGTYLEPSETIFTKNLTIIGADRTTTIIRRAAAGWTGWYFFRVNAGRLSLSNVTLDGEGTLYGGVRLVSPGTATLNNNIFRNMRDAQYHGFGIVAFTSDMIVSNNIFTNIERVGVWVGTGNNNLVTGNTYTGKGVGDWLDYAIEVGEGGVATITGNTITNCRGVASLDGSVSAGILVSTHFAGGTRATITGNTLTGNTWGIAIGYNAADTSVVTANFNNISGNTYGVGTWSGIVTTDARNNWWGDNSGPGGSVTDPVTGTLAIGSGNNVTANVRFDPWTYRTSQTATATGTGSATFTPTAGTPTAVTAVAQGSLPALAQVTRPMNFPHGLFSFNITGLTPGATVNVTITLPPGPTPTQYWKYLVPEGWVRIPMTVVAANVIIITLVDGGLGDDDEVANGVIVDQGGPGIPWPVGWEPHPVSTVRVLLPWIALLAAIMAGASLVVIRRRRAQS